MGKQHTIEVYFDGFMKGVLKIKPENKVKLKISFIIVLISIFFPITRINDGKVALGYPIGYVSFNLRSFSLLDINYMKYKTILQFISINIINMLIDTVIVYFIIKMLVYIYGHMLTRGREKS